LLSIQHVEALSVMSCDDNALVIGGGVSLTDLVRV
jgi:hypothetical protein